MKKLICVLGILSICSMVGFTAATDKGITYALDGNVDIGGTLNVNSTFTLNSTKLSKEVIIIDPLKAGATTYKNTTATKAQLLGLTSTYTLAGSGYTDVTNPRNVQVKLIPVSGSTTNQIQASVTITGVDHKGSTVTEILTSTNTSTEIMTSSTAWNSITSYAVAVSTWIEGILDTSIRVQFGAGDRYGLGCNITTSAEILKIIENGSVVATTGTSVDTSYDTINFATDATRDTAGSVTAGNYYKVIVKPLIQ